MKKSMQLRKRILGMMIPGQKKKYVLCLVLLHGTCMDIEGKKRGRLVEELWSLWYSCNIMGIGRESEA